MTAPANTVTSPKCGTENPATAMNCRNCRINLKYALENPDALKVEAQEAMGAQVPPEDPGLGQLMLTVLSVASLVVSVPLIFIGLSNATYRNPGCPACEAMGNFFGEIIAGVGALFLLVGAGIMLRSVVARRK